MSDNLYPTETAAVGAILTAHDVSKFHPGDRVIISDRSSIDRVRVPQYLRGTTATIEAVIASASDADIGTGPRSEGVYPMYRVVVPMTEIWSDYAGSSGDGLRLVVTEAWLERH